MRSLVPLAIVAILIVTLTSNCFPTTFAEPPFLPNVLVSGSEGNGSGTWGGFRALSVATAPNGTVYVSWQHEFSGPTLYTYLAASTDGGVSYDTPRRISDVGGLQMDPVVVVDRGFRMHLVWYTSTEGVYYTRSDDGGTSFQTARLVGVNGGRPDIDVDESGRVYILYERTTDLYVIRSDDNGDTFGAPVRVDDGPGLSAQTSARMALEPDGSIHVVWMDDRAKSWAFQIFYTSSEDGGATFGPGVRVNDDPLDLNSISGPDVAVDSLGTIHVVWRSCCTTRHGYYYSNSTDGGITFGNGVYDDDMDKRITDWWGADGATDIIADTMDALHVPYSFGWNVLYTNSTDRGTTWGDGIFNRNDLHVTEDDTYNSIWPAADVDSCGTIYVAWLDSRNTRKDIYASALPRLSTDVSIFDPDMTLTPTGSPTVGDTVMVGATVHNYCGIAIPQATVRFFDGEPGTGTPIDGDQIVTSLAPKTGSAYVEVPWTPTIAGQHRLCAVVDPDNIVAEYDETNNVGCFSVNVLGLTPPDYIPVNPIPSDLISIGPSVPIDLSIGVTNLGDAVNLSSMLAFHNGTTPGSPFELFILPPIPFGDVVGPYVGTWISPTLPGTYTVVASVDYYNEILEYDETNNLYTWTIEVILPSRPDLAVLDSEVNVTPASVFVGQSVSFSATVWNIGNASANATIALFLDADMDRFPDPGEVFDSPSISLSPGANETFVRVWVATARGTHSLCAYADPDDFVAEDDEGNNVGCASVLVTTPPQIRPDYVPSQPLPSSPVRTGLSMPLSLSILVRNDGNDTAKANATLAFSNESMPPFVTFMVTPITPSNVSARFTANWISPATPGTYRVTADVDYSDDVFEWNETNNVYTWTIDVVSKPITSLVIGSPNYTAAVTYIKSTTPLDLFVIDQGGSGINHTWYRIDNVTWIEYSSSFFLTGEGDHYVEWYSEDNAGNLEETASIVLRVDDTPPATSLFIGDPKYETGGNFIKSSTPLTLQAVDDGVTPVGLDYTEYRVDGGGWDVYSSPFFLTGEGEHALEFRSFDLLMNEEIIKLVQLIVDDTSPATKVSVGQPKHQNVELYITSNTEISLTSTDGGMIPVGLYSTEYKIDDGTWQRYTSAFSLSGGEGAHVIGYNSTDLLGNVESTNTITVYLDDTPPATTIDIGQPKHQDVELYVTSNTAINLTSTDGGVTPVGLDAIGYRLDGGSWRHYASTFTLTGSDGPCVIEYNSTDLLGNVESVNVFTVHLDNTPPATTMEPATGPYSLDTVFTLTAADGGSGVNVTRYRIDGGAWTTYSGSFTLTEGTHNVSFYSIDMLDNTEAERWREVTIQGQPPPPTVEVEANYKPLVALIFSIVIALTAAYSTRRRPFSFVNGDRKRFLLSWAVLGVPFIAAEAVTGILSIYFEPLRIPPVIGWGTGIDMAILIAGMVFLLLRLVRGKRVELES